VIIVVIKTQDVVAQMSVLRIAWLLSSSWYL